MKKVYVAIIIIFFIMMVFFTFHGDEVYNRIHPNVHIIRLSEMMTIEDITYVVIPKTALVDEEYVYTVMSNQGFSMDILTIEKRKVEWRIIENEAYDDNYVFVISGIKINDKIISKSTENLSDGMRVTSVVK